MIDAEGRLWISDGNGGAWAEDWRELLQAVFRVLAYAIAFKARGACRCGCRIALCEYCAHECGGAAP